MEPSKVRQRPIRALTAAEFAASTEAAPVLRLNRLASGPRIAAVSVVMAVLAGCAVGPDFESPAAPDVGGYRSEPLAKQTSSADVKGGEAQRFIQNLDIPGQWWTLFHSERSTPWSSRL
jgi:hypothetical protein